MKIVVEFEFWHAFPQEEILVLTMLTGYHGHGSFIVSIVRFVSCLAFICNQDSQQWYLLSGGGDSTVSKFLK